MGSTRLGPKVAAAAPSAASPPAARRCGTGLLGGYTPVQLPNEDATAAAELAAEHYLTNSTNAQELAATGCVVNSNATDIFVIAACRQVGRMLAHGGITAAAALHHRRACGEQGLHALKVLMQAQGPYPSDRPARGAACSSSPAAKLS